MSSAQRMMAPRPARATPMRRIDSTTPTEAPLRDFTTLSAAPRRPAYLHVVDPTLATVARMAEAAPPRSAPDAGMPAARREAAPAAVPEERPAAGADATGPEGPPEAAGAEGGAAGGPAPGILPMATSPGSPRGAAGATGSTRRAARKPPEPPDPQPVITEIPVPETGPVTLDAPAIDAPRASGSFDAPRELGITPAPTAGRPRAGAAALIERHRSVFADAIARIIRLQADLLDLARNLAPTEIEAAARRANAAEHDLDVGLEALDEALVRARGDLEARAGILMLQLETEAASAHTAIRSAASRAYGAVAAATARLSAERDAVGVQYWDPLGALLDTQARNIRQAANAATTALRTVGELAAAQFAAGATPLAAAQNEEKLVRLPARAGTEAHELELARDYDAHVIEAKKPTVTAAKTEAMRPLQRRVEALRTEAPRAIAHTRAEALHQLDKQARGLRNALTSGRAGAHAALVGQHRAARSQMIASARQRMAAQQDEARARLGDNQAAATGMAGGMPVAARSLHESLAAQRRRPTDQFAQVVVNASTTLVKQLEGAAPARIGQLHRAGTETAAAQDANAAVAADGFRTATVTAGDSVVSAAAQAGEQLERQIMPALPGLAALATPVARSIDGFVRPLAQACKAEIDAMAAGVKKLRASLEKEYTDGVPLAEAAGGPAVAGGVAGAPAGAAPAGGAAQAASEPAAPREAGPTPGGFVRRVQAILPAPLAYAPLVELASKVDSRVSENVTNRAYRLHNTLAASNVGETFVHLRGLTRLSAAAVEATYNAEGENLRDDIRSGLTKFFSTDYTNRTNVSAALSYLNGNAAEGARLEMEVAIFLSNDNERVKLAARGLTPTQMAQLANSEAGAATLQSVHDDLNDATQEVFDALRDRNTDRADAIELRNRIDETRKKAGAAGADQTVDAIAAASQAGPQGLLAGADPLGLGLDADRGVADPAAHWQRVQRQFAGLRGVPTTVPGGVGPLDSAGALVAYATRPLDYWVESRDPATYNPRTGQPAYTQVREGITGPNRDLIDDLARHGEGSPEARASRMAVEMHRSGGADMTRLSTATYDPRMNTELAMDPRDPQAAQHAQAALDRAQHEREQALRIYADRYAPGLRGNPQGVRDLLANQARLQVIGDPDRAAYAASMVSQDMPDPLLALNYGLNGDRTRMDVLRRTMGSLRRDQLDAAVRRYNAQEAAHGRPGLEDKLGLYGRHGGDITGDETQEIERMMLGVAVTDRERAEVAALQARQQREGEGFLGRGLNTLGGEQQRLDRNYNRLITAMGVTETNFDERGRLRVRDPLTGATAGHFEPNGVFKPTATASLDTLNAAMIGARLSAEGYAAATDRMANYITTALMVAAAVITTALTGGAAAGFWAVALTATAVTLTAGVVGIGATYALKGSRYTAHEAEHDLAVTAVQAATAGIGAGLGVVLKGAAVAAGRLGPTLAQEMAVGGFTSALGSAGQAAIDHRSVGDAFLRGLVGGSLGVAAARPFGRLLSQEAGQIERAAVRSATSATSGAVSRAGEIAYDTGTGEDTRSFGEKIEDVRAAAVQNAIQGGLEQGGEHFGEQHRARAARRLGGPQATPHGPPRGTAPPPGHPVVRPPAAEHPIAAPEISGAGPAPARPATHEFPPAAPAPARPLMPEAPHGGAAAPTIHSPAPEMEPHAPTRRPPATAAAERSAHAPPAPERPVPMPEIPPPHEEPAAPHAAAPRDEAAHPRPGEPQIEAPQRPLVTEPARPPAVSERPAVGEPALPAMPRSRPEPEAPPARPIPGAEPALPPLATEAAPLRATTPEAQGERVPAPEAAAATPPAGPRPEIAGTAAAVPESALFHGESNASVPGNAERVGARARSFLDNPPARFDVTPNPPEGVAMALPGPPPRRVAIEIRTADPATLPREGGRVPVAHFEGHPGGAGFDARYVVTVSAGTHPENVGPGLAHELGEIRTLEQRRAAGESGAAAAEGRAAGAGTPGRLSAHEVGQLEQLRVRHEQIDAARDHVVALGADHPDHPAALQQLERLRQDADDLLVHMGLVPPRDGGGAAGAADLRRLVADAAEIDRHTAGALDRQLGDALARRLPGVAAEENPMRLAAALAESGGLEHLAAGAGTPRRSDLPDRAAALLEAGGDLVRRAVAPAGFDDIPTVTELAQILADLPERLRQQGRPQAEIDAHVDTLREIMAARAGVQPPDLLDRSLQNLSIPKPPKPGSTDADPGPVIRRNLALLEEVRILVGDDMVRRIAMAETQETQERLLGTRTQAPTDFFAPSADASPAVRERQQRIHERMQETLPGRLRSPLAISDDQAATLAQRLVDRREMASLASAARAVERWRKNGVPAGHAEDYRIALQQLLRYGEGAATSGIGIERWRIMRERERLVYDPAVRAITDDPAGTFRDLPDADRQRLRELAGQDTKASRQIAELAYRSPEDLLSMWRNWRQAGADKTVPSLHELTPPGFKQYIDARMADQQVPKLGEVTAAFLLGHPGRPPEVPSDEAALRLAILKAPPDVDYRTGASRNEPKDPGSDIVGVRPNGRIVYADEKSLSQNTVAEAPAIVPNLRENLVDDANLLEANVNRARALGQPVDSRVEGAITRMRACADELNQPKFSPEALAAALDPGQPANPQLLADFAEIVGRHQIDLVVTSAGGNVTSVSPRLREAGVRFVRSTLPIIRFRRGSAR